MAQIALASGWRALDGHAFGLPQRTLVGHLRVRDAQAGDSARLDAWLLPGVPAAALPDEPEDPAEALARRFLFWAGEIQRHARVAISPALHVRAADAIGPAGADAGTLAKGDRAFDVAMACDAAAAARLTLNWLARATNRVLGDDAAPQPPVGDSLPGLLEQLKPHAEPGYNRLHLLLCAYRMGVAVSRLTGRVVRLGTGAQARLMDSSLTDRTPAVGVALARNKWLTAQMLRHIGVPATVNERADTADAAVAVAHRLGWPVVVKPADQDQGLGVAAHLVHDDAVRQAFAAAVKVSPHVLVERHVHGFGHRLTLMDGELVAVLKRIPGGVTGDGRHSVAELVALQLASPEVQRQRNMGRVPLDDEAQALLADRGQSPQTVPAEGEFVLLRRRDNLSAGGRLEHLDPATVHPDNLLAAQRAAKALHLDLAGIDFLSPDITVSWQHNGAAICEVNAQPQFGAGRRGDNYDRLLNHLLGPQPQIQTHLYLSHGDDEPGLHETLLALRDRLGAQALCHRGGVWLQQTRLTGACNGAWQAARAALADRDVPSLVMALSARDIIAHGLPVARIDSLHLAPASRGDEAADDQAARAQALAWCACEPSPLLAP